MELVRDLLPENLWKTMVRKLGREEALRLMWRTVAGPRLAAQTGLRQLRGTTLVVSVPDSQWTRSLQPLEKMILDAVNRFPDSWRATSIEFVVEPRQMVAAASPKPVLIATTAERQIDDSAARKIGDERVREAFIESQQKYFARQEGSRK